MSVPRIRGDYEQLAQIAQTFGTQADQLNAMLKRIKAQQGNLAGGDWMGVGARQFYQEMDTQVQPALQRLINAMQQARQVTSQISAIVKQAETDAAACFKLNGASGGEAGGGSAAGDPADGAAPSPAGPGAGSGETPSSNTPAGAPKTMGELYKLIEDQLQRDNPVKVVQTGPNEYMVLVRGTDPASHDATFNAGGALDGGATGHSDYMRQIKAYLAQTLPPGANVTLVGHSQGGIAVNDLADDQALRGQYNIQNVITFGAPEAAFKQPATRYYAEKNPLDAVTYVDRTSLSNPAALAKNLAGIGIGAGEIAYTYVTTGSIDNIAHLSYENSAAGKPLPPGVEFSQWREVTPNQPFNWAPPQHGLAGVWNSGAQAIGQGNWSSLPRVGADLLGEGTKFVTATAVNTIADPIINRLPTGLRNTIDGYRDHLTDTFLNSPTVSQVISNIWPFGK